MTMTDYDTNRGQRSQPDHQPHSQPYRSTSHARDYEHDTQSTSSSSYPASFQHDSLYYDTHRPRSPALSVERSDGQPPTQQPLNNALNKAFDRSDTARAVDPDLIAQITAEVKKSVLEEFKKQPQLAPVPTPQLAPLDFSSASLPTRNVYTPPTPHRPDQLSQGSSSPDALTRDPLLDGVNDGDAETSRYGRRATAGPPTEQSTQSRPSHVPRLSTDSDFTPIEKIWQRLFDNDHQPTPRLGQFLRGLAVHLINDYEPKKSLVVTPAKMLKFYEDVKIQNEIYPWQKIFRELSYSSLSKIYRELRCQHHLVQEHPADQPFIPALTPEGFRDWMIVMIQAYPDTEYERLSKTVLDMPISNADDAKERFPKELPRRLLPPWEHLHAQQRCAAILNAEGVGPLRRAPTFPPPPPKSQSVPPTQMERERSPYANLAESKLSRSDNDDDDAPPSIQLERERKPYSAAPGGGKSYDDTNQSVHPDASTHEQRRRAQSTASQSQKQPPPAVTHQSRTSHAAGGRSRSPISNAGSKSDPSVRDVPENYHASHDSEEVRRRYGKDVDSRQHERSRRHESDPIGPSRRKSMVDTDSSYARQPRSVYDDDYYRGRGNGYDDKGSDPRRY